MRGRDQNVKGPRKQVLTTEGTRTIWPGIAKSWRRDIKYLMSCKVTKFRPKRTHTKADLVLIQTVHRTKWAVSPMGMFKKYNYCQSGYPFETPGDSFKFINTRAPPNQLN